MPLNATLKNEIIQNFANHTGDTGSSQLQIALLQSRISQITGHLKLHPKDEHSRRGLLLLVGKRRKHERYLRAIDIQKYRDLAKKLGIRELKTHKS